ncbi:hypothetical protein Efla_005530 [Eimeria flavescens]
MTTSANLVQWGGKQQQLRCCRRAQQWLLNYGRTTLRKNGVQEPSGAAVLRLGQPRASAVVGRCPIACATFLCVVFSIIGCCAQGTSRVEEVCSSDKSGCTQRLIIELDVKNQDKLQFHWQAGNINDRSPRKSDAGNAGVVVTVQKTEVSYAYNLTYIKAVPFNWVEYAHRAALWQVKDGGANFCADSWGSKCQDEHGDDGFPTNPNTGLPVDGAQGKCCWCPAVWHLWLKNPNRGREPKLKCNFWGLRFGKIPDPYLTKFCPTVEYPWYRMLKASDKRKWFFKVHVGISWWRPPSPSKLSDEAYLAACEKKIAAGTYPRNFDCSQRLHTEAGMADSILELSESRKAARDCTNSTTQNIHRGGVVLQEPNVKGKYVFVPTAPATNAWVKESLITEGCSDSANLTHWGVTEDENPDLVRLCKSVCEDVYRRRQLRYGQRKLCPEVTTFSGTGVAGSPFCNPKSCLKHVLILGENDVTVDGSKCDLPGVSLEQWGRDGFCDYQPGSCFSKNLKWFHKYNESATAEGRNPPYALEYPPGNYPRYSGNMMNASEAIDVSKAGPFELHRLAFVYPNEHTSKVRIEMNAGLIRWIQSTAPGTRDATFYLELPYCTEHGSSEPTDKLDPVPAVQRTVQAGTSQAFDLTLRLMAVVEQFDFNCVMKLYDSELNQLDVKTFDVLTGTARDLPGAVTNPTGEVVVVQPPPDKRNWYQRLMNVVPNDGECDCSFWNLLCLPADWADCWSTLKRTLKVVFFAGISLVALFLLWPVLKPLIKMVCKCAVVPFKCLRSVGEHQRARTRAKKWRKKEERKLAKKRQEVLSGKQTVKSASSSVSWKIEGVELDDSDSNLPLNCSRGTLSFNVAETSSNNSGRSSLETSEQRAKLKV